MEGGFLHKWLTYCEPFEFSDSYAAFSLLACASAAVNGRVIVNPSHVPTVFTNLYVLLYGPSGARKGEAMRHALNLLSEAVPETPIKPDDFTMEALTSLLAQESKETGGCSGLVVQEEFSDLIGGADYALRNTKLLTRLWDCRPVSTRLTHAHGLEHIENPYIVGLWSSAPGWIEQTDPRSLASGFLRRVLIVNELRPKRENASPKPNKLLLSELVKLMTQRLGAGAFEHADMELTEEARERMGEWYYSRVSELRRKADERTGHFASCMQAHMLKLAALLNLLEGRGAMRLEESSVEEAIGLLDAIVTPLFHVYASLVPTPYARLRAIVVRSVQSFGEGAPSSEVDRAVVNAAGVKPKDASEARLHLIQEGVLVTRPGKPGWVFVGEV